MPKFGGLLLFRPIVLVIECSCSRKTRKVYQLTFTQLKVFLEKNRIRYLERFHRKIYSPLTFNKIVSFLAGKLQHPWKTHLKLSCGSGGVKVILLL